LKHWFKDEHLRSLLKNSSYLAVSKAVGAVFGLATLAFAARGLGLVLFGTLILISSYAKAVSGIAKFQSWQLIVRYGGHGIAHGDPDHFKVATGFAFSLDLISGIGGMLVGAALLPFIGHWFGLSNQYLWLALFFCTSLPTMASATPTGVLRVLDRFDLISWGGTAGPISRAILAGIAYFAGASFPIFVAVWWVTEIFDDLLLWFLAWRELRRTGHLEGIRPTLRPTALRGAWRFAIEVNLTSSIDAVWGPIGRLVVGGLLGPAGAGLFRLASELADGAQKPGDLLARAFYPEVVRMDLSSKKPWKLMLRASVLIGGVALVAILVLFLGGKPLISLLFGEKFLGAYAPLMILMAVPFIGIFSFALLPMLYALGQSNGPLKAKLLGSVIFFLTIAPLSLTMDVAGAALALVLGNVANVIAMTFQLQREYRRIRRPSGQAPSRDSARSA
jgi:O-antigen/teichoic acid export membrane protein